MTNYVVTEKVANNTSIQGSKPEISLNGPSIVALDLKKDDIAKIEYEGNSMIITLKNGEKLTISPIQVVDGQLSSDVVLTGDGTQFEQVIMNKTEDGSWLLDKYSKLNTLDSLLISENRSGGIGLLGLAGGAVGAGIAAYSVNESSDRKDGINGVDGTDGVNGKSAYELAVDHGYTGTVEEWLHALVGKDGINGVDGTDGVNGKSAFELAVEKGYTGTADEWLQSIVGQNGTNGIDGLAGLTAYEIAVKNGFNGTESAWLLSLVGAKGETGLTGLSAFDLAVQNGFEGTLTEWLQSLKGATGADGKSAFELAVEKGYTGTEQEWLDSLKGLNGKSAYELAVENGFTGTEAEWIASLKGQDGADGEGLELPKVKILKNTWQELSGTADVGSEITILFIRANGEQASYTTLAQQDGTWKSPTNYLGNYLGTNYLGLLSDVNTQISVYSKNALGYRSNVEYAITSGIVVGDRGPNSVAGYAAPNSTIQVTMDGSDTIYTAQVDKNGNWEITDLTVNPLKITHYTVEYTQKTDGFVSGPQDQFRQAMTISFEDQFDSVNDKLMFNYISNNLGVAFGKLQIELTGLNNETLILDIQKTQFGQYYVDTKDIPFKSDYIYGFKVVDTDLGVESEYDRFHVVYNKPDPAVVIENSYDELSGTAPSGLTLSIVTNTPEYFKTVVAEDGTWSFKPNPLDHQEVANITVQDMVSGVFATIPYVQLYPTPTEPTIETCDANVLSGVGSAGSYILVRIPQSNVEIKVDLDENGHWSINPNPAQAGQVTVISAIDATTGLESGRTTIETIVDNPRISLYEDKPDLLSGVVSQTNQYIVKTSSGGVTNYRVLDANQTVTLTNSRGVKFVAEIDELGNWKFEPNPLGQKEVGTIVAVSDLTGQTTEIITVVGKDLTAPNIVLDYLENGHLITGHFNEAISKATLKVTMIDGRVLTFDAGQALLYVRNGESQNDLWNISLGMGESRGITQMELIATDISGNTSSKVINNPFLLLEENTAGLLHISGGRPNEQIVVKDVMTGNTVTLTLDKDGHAYHVPNTMSNSKLEYKYATPIIENHDYTHNYTDAIYKPVLVDMTDNQLEIMTGGSYGADLFKVFDENLNLVATQGISRESYQKYIQYFGLENNLNISFEEWVALNPDIHNFDTESYGRFVINLDNINLVAGKTYYMELSHSINPNYITKKVSFVYEPTEVEFKFLSSYLENTWKLDFAKNSKVEAIAEDGSVYEFPKGWGGTVYPSALREGQKYILRVTDTYHGTVQEKEVIVRHNDIEKSEISVKSINLDEAGKTYTVYGVSSIPNAVVGYKIYNNTFNVKADENGSFEIRIPKFVLANGVDSITVGIKEIYIIDEETGYEAAHNLLYAPSDKLLTSDSYEIQSAIEKPFNSLVVNDGVLVINPNGFVATHIQNIYFRDLLTNEVVLKQYNAENLTGGPIRVNVSDLGIGEWIVTTELKSGDWAKPMYLNIDKAHNVAFSMVLPEHAQLGKQDDILTVLNFAEDNAGQEIKHVGKDIFEEANIDISDLLVGFDLVKDDINDFLSVVVGDEGTTVKIDRDGSHDRFNSVDLILFEGVSKSLIDLLDADHLIVTNA